MSEISKYAMLSASLKICAMDIELFKEMLRIFSFLEVLFCIYCINNGVFYYDKFLMGSSIFVLIMIYSLHKIDFNERDMKEIDNVIQKEKEKDYKAFLKFTGLKEKEHNEWLWV